jgi:hypothetical protein
MDQTLLVKNGSTARTVKTFGIPLVHAIGGTSPEAHRAGLERVTQAGAQPVSWDSLACSLAPTVPATTENGGA